MSGRVLGLDPGERRIGVAISDPDGIIASPHTVLDRRRGDVLAALRRIVTEYEVESVIVGLPRNLGGTEGPAAVAARTLGSQVVEHLQLQVEYEDERYTTVQAEAALLEANVSRSDRRDRRDKVAAALMLQGYLDRHRRTDGRGDEQ